MRIFNFLSCSLLLCPFVYSDFDTRKLTESQAQEERVVIPMASAEQKKWEFLFYQLSRDRSSVYEWIPRGEKLDGWTKMVQIQFIPLDGDDVSAKDFATAFIQKLKQVEPTASGTILSQMKDRALVEWSVPVDTKEISAQNELSLFISTIEGIYRVAYTEKVPSMNPEAKKMWIERLSEVKIGEPTTEAS